MSPLRKREESTVEMRPEINTPLPPGLLDEEIQVDMNETTHSRIQPGIQGVSQLRSRPLQPVQSNELVLPQPNESVYVEAPIAFTSKVRLTGTRYDFLVYVRGLPNPVWITRNQANGWTIISD